MTTLARWQGVAQDHGDLNRKFQHSYVYASVKGEPPDTVFIEQVGWTTRNGSIGLLYRSVDSKGDQKKIDCELSEFDIINPLPDPGVYSLNDDGIAIVRRIPARQWLEGLYLGNTMILLNGEKLMSSRDVRVIPFGTAKQLFTPQVDLPLNAARAILKPNKCIRLNNHYWLKSESKKNDTVGLMRDTTRIGSWTTGTFFLTSSAKILKEELKDELGIHA